MLRRMLCGKSLHAYSSKKLAFTLFLITIISFMVNFTPLRADVIGEQNQIAYFPESAIVVPDDYPSIQEAVDAASQGDIIIVRIGVYYEKVTINKRNLIIVGEERERTVIDGEGDGPIVQIEAENVTFTGFTLRKSGSKSGVKILNYANFSFNIVSQCQIGVEVGAKSVVSHNIIYGCGQGVLLYYCSKVIVQKNNFSRNTVGVALHRAYNNSVLNNTITESVTGGHGITVLSSSSNNLIYGNFICNNSHGIWLSGSSNNLIVGNTIAKNNILGIELTDAPNNTLYHNNFIDNKKQVTTNTVNRWDNGYPSGGNYWSDYESRYPDAEDIYCGEAQDSPGSDGIWDTPYKVYKENVDRYPLVEPFGKIPDNRSPVTVHDYDGLWHNEDIVITLTASDDLSGVKETYYKINNAETVKKVSIDGQPVIDVEGANNTIEYWSVDYMGNEEKHKVLTNIKLDKTPPVADAGQNLTVVVGTSVVFSANASYDELSGISKFRWDLGNGIVKFEKEFTYNFSDPGTYKIILTVYDAAGNYATDTILVTVVASEDIPSIIFPISAVLIILTVFLSLIFRRKKKRKYKSKRIFRK